MLPYLVLQFAKFRIKSEIEARLAFMDSAVCRKEGEPEEGTKTPKEANLDTLTRL